MNARTAALSQVITYLFLFPIFAIIRLSEAYLESINGNQIKFDTLREVNEKKSIVQEPQSFFQNFQALLKLEQTLSHR